MADAELLQRYKSVGRGRGILGLKEYIPCKRPGLVNDLDLNTNSNNSTVTELEQQDPTKPLVVRHNYQANPESPGGFKELTVSKGQMLKFLVKHSTNEHWWEVENEDGEVGYVPASYVIQKEETNLPWLEGRVLQMAEDERKERVRRLNQEKLCREGKGFGPAPMSNMPQSFTNAVAAIKRQSSECNYCTLCGKQFNGPIPYKMHLASKAHREEEEAQKAYIQ